MEIEISGEGVVAVIRGGSGKPARVVAEALEALAGGPARAAVLILEGAAPSHDPAALDSLALTPLPLIAAITGDLAGGAAELALACDIRLIAAEAAIDLAAGPRLALLAPRLGPGRCAAQAALDAGLVSEIVNGSVTARAAQVAAVIAARGPIATRFAKEAIWRGLAMPLPQALRFETDLTLLLQTTKDRAEGVRAFLEKRPPTFVGE